MANIEEELKQEEIKKNKGETKDEDWLQKSIQQRKEQAYKKEEEKRRKEEEEFARQMEEEKRQSEKMKVLVEKRFLSSSLSYFNNNLFLFDPIFKPPDFHYIPFIPPQNLIFAYEFHQMKIIRYTHVPEHIQPSLSQIV